MAGGGDEVAVELLREARAELGAPNQRTRSLSRRDALVELIAERSDVVTIRQVYYLATARGIVPKTEEGYKFVVTDLSVLRRSGAVPWGAIEDRTRTVHYKGAQAQPEMPDSDAIVECIQEQYYGHPYDGDSLVRLASAAAVEALKVGAERGPQWGWIDGPRPVVLIEKDALWPAAWRVANEYNTPCVSTRGMPSLSQLRDLAGAITQDEHCDRHVILWLHDFDNAGRYMRESSVRSLGEDFGCAVAVEHVALTAEQVREWEIQTRPEKTGKGVAAELDAIEPDAFRNIIREAIGRYVPEGHYEEVRQRIRAINEQLQEAVREYLYDADGALSDEAQELLSAAQDW